MSENRLLVNSKIKETTQSFYIINFHAKKHIDHPQDEIKHLSNYTNRLGSKNIILLGDFNLNEKHPVWTYFYEKGYQSALINTKTTLKKECKEEAYMYHAMDNVYYKTEKIKKLNSGVIDVVKDCDNLSKVRGVSDHLPVFMDFVIGTK